MNRTRNNQRVRVGVDTGGTFTDFIFEWRGRFQVFKVPSTPDDPSRAIREGLRAVAQETRVPLFKFEVVHGTTVGTNALLQRKGATIALITTAGFEDVIEIGRQARPELYNLNAIKPPPLVSRDLRFGLNERIAASGKVLTQLNDKEIERLVAKLLRAKVEAVAISFLFSFVDPRHEKRVSKALAKLKIPISVSQEILPEYREYERISTVTINAYLQPLMGQYLSRLGNLRDGFSRKSAKRKGQSSEFSLRVMQSSGGSISGNAAAAEPVRTILSGPAGGVVGALRVARHAGLANIITFDMGGTSTDVALCDEGGVRLTNEAVVAGLPVAVPMMDIHTVGAGGGSIARVDEGGSLRVGPESAGADPGPACYGQSLLPTVTDAHVVLGHFPGGALLGGDFHLNEARAGEVMKKLAAEMSRTAKRNVSPVEAAQGVLDVVDTNMERALRHISVERGHDPRDFNLLPFGGAGGLHAVALARALRIPCVIVPSSPGALSAIGVVTADVIKDQSRTVMTEAAPGVEKKLDRIFRTIEAHSKVVLLAEGFSPTQQRHERSLAARYQGQSFELQIKQTSGDIAKAFHRAHQARYGYAQERNVVEIVSVRVRSIGAVKPLKIAREPVTHRSDLANPDKFVDAYFEGKKVRAAVYRREALKSNSRLRVPCIVTEYSGTTLILAGTTAQVDEGNLIIKT